MIPLSLYIHIPWCEKKCPYCDFNSHLAKTPIDQKGYIQTLLDDFEADLKSFDKVLIGRSIQSIFIGGGTPSLFDPESFDHLLSKLKQHIPFADDIEITLEANPGSSEAGKFKGFYQAGINRLSIGVQSFNTEHLTALGRVHNSEEAINAAVYAKDAGFDNFNLDLMFGLPNQTVEQSIADLTQAIELKPNHLSCYQLTIEPNTLFHHHPPVTPDDEALWEMQTCLQTELTNNGYQQYEVSAYAKNNMVCQHNLNYWSFGDYLAIGAGAHGKLTNTDGQVTRYWKRKHPASYIEKSKKVGSCDVIAPGQLPFEFMLNALRLTNGFDLGLYQITTSLEPDVIESILQNHRSQGLIEITDGNVQQTTRGKQMIDTMLQDYLPD